MSNIIWIIVIGFIAGIIARFLSPGPNDPTGFILTTVLGIAGAFLATFIGQTIGWYRLDQGAGLIGATVGALMVLFIWNRLVSSHVMRDPGVRPQRGTSRPQRGGIFATNSAHRALQFGSGPRTSDNNRRRIWDCTISSPACRTARAASAQPQQRSGSGGGMSPMVMALLGLLAYKAFKGSGGQSRPVPGGTGKTRLPQGGTHSRRCGRRARRSSRRSVRRGRPGQPAGSHRPGRRPRDISRRIGRPARRRRGRHRAERRPRQPDQGIPAERPRPRRAVLGRPRPERGDRARRSGRARSAPTRSTRSASRPGWDRTSCSGGCSHQLPDFVDQLTPNGRLPTEEEASRMV